MKAKLSVFLFIIGLFFFYSCSKSNSSPGNPIVGLWIGTYTSPQTQGHNYYYSYDIRTDSSILVQGLGADGNTYYANGTWSLSGTSFSATITSQNLSQAGAVQTVTAQYSNNNGVLTGQVLLVGGNFSNAATFTLNRIN